jgi:hypothetical protein
MLLIRGFTNLHFGGAVVMDSPSKAVAMAQTEHSTVGGNPDGHAQGKKLHWLPLPAFLFRKKKKTRNDSRRGTWLWNIQGNGGGG